ncbi:alpha/beta fold hydrolase [Aquihabitans sp. McL0605]|uniref:alpha/beta fold hydrolase n=1 Tax=Aquihabitans sp. McL0605 TaxID=3415671 RepID=UPI003CF063FC
MSPERTTRFLTHVKVRLALHELRPGTGRPLLLVHGLGESTPTAPPPFTESWPGPVLGLDLTGHGESSRAPGGGYTAEVLMADVDAALAVMGPCTVVGRGLGAYVALLIAGARPELVVGAVLCDGPGLAGGGATPNSPILFQPAQAPAAVPSPGAPPDPFALIEMARDVRPGDYASTYARLALQFSGRDDPIAIAALVRPPWLTAVAAEPGVVIESLAAALRRYAAVGLSAAPA